MSKYCCDYAYWCPTQEAVGCFVHGPDVCCDHEELHECLADQYGAEDGISFGDGFVCMRCGNYEIVGVKHSPATEPGFPRRTGPSRTGSWLDDPPEVETR